MSDRRSPLVWSRGWGDCREVVGWFVGQLGQFVGQLGWFVGQLGLFVGQLG